MSAIGPRQNVALVDMARIDAHRPEEFWDEVVSEPGDRVVLDPERFYLLLSDEAVRVPPGLACEMTAFDPTAGELRTHYAGFFDPGFGYDEGRELRARGRRSRCVRTTCRSWSNTANASASSPSSA